MPRPRARACLQDGLKLDLNRLAQNGLIRPGARSGPIGIRWYSTYCDKEIASGLITANMIGTQEGWLRLQLGDFDEWIILVARPRHFGGRQWYFMCPAMNRPVSVLWRPPGARTFRSRKAWGRQVAYRSQFSDQDNRAHLGKERIKARLIADLDPDQWDLRQNRNGCGGPHTISMWSATTTTRPFWTTDALRSRPSSEKISLKINDRIQVSQEISIQPRGGVQSEGASVHQKWLGHPNLKLRPHAPARGRGRLQVQQIYDWTHARRRMSGKPLLRMERWVCGRSCAMWLSLSADRQADIVAAQVLISPLTICYTSHGL